MEIFTIDGIKVECRDLNDFEAKRELFQEIACDIKKGCLMGVLASPRYIPEEYIGAQFTVVPHECEG